MFISKITKNGLYILQYSIRNKKNLIVVPMEFLEHLFNISTVSDDLTVVLVGPDEVEAGDVRTQAAELVVIRAVAEATKFIIMFFLRKDEVGNLCIASLRVLSHLPLT